MLQHFVQQRVAIVIALLFALLTNATLILTCPFLVHRSFPQPFIVRAIQSQLSLAFAIGSALYSLNSVYTVDCGLWLLGGICIGGIKIGLTWFWLHFGRTKQRPSRITRPNFCCRCLRYLITSAIAAVAMNGGRVVFVFDRDDRFFWVIGTCPDKMTWTCTLHVVANDTLHFFVCLIIWAYSASGFSFEARRLSPSIGLFLSLQIVLSSEWLLPGCDNALFVLILISSQPETDVRIKELLTGRYLGCGLIQWPVALSGVAPFVLRWCKCRSRFRENSINNSLFSVRILSIEFLNRTCHCHAFLCCISFEV